MVRLWRDEDLACEVSTDPPGEFPDEEHYLPASTVTGLVEKANELLESLIGIERAGEAGAMEEFEEAQHELEDALSAFKQEVE